MKNGIFKLGLIASSISAILSPSVALAQDAESTVNSDIEVISVSGIRGALARSQAEKK